jgi:rare lipoprotein A
VASYYGPGFQGRRTASGERFSAGAMTAAHRTLPFNTRVRVTNLRNGRDIVVRINDRGPYVRGRIIDLTTAAARRIGIGGTAPVTLETCL